MKTYELPNSQIVEVYTLKELAAEIRNPMTFAVYGKFKLGDIDTGVEYTLEEAMKREDENVSYDVVLY